MFCLADVLPRRALPGLFDISTKARWPPPVDQSEAADKGDTSVSAASAPSFRQTDLSATRSSAFQSTVGRMAALHSDNSFTTVAMNRPLSRFGTLLLFSFAIEPVLAEDPVLAESPVYYLESDGVVVFEVESTALQGDWVLETTLSDYTGSGYIRWDGDNFYRKADAGQGALTYHVTIENAGNYQIFWRSRISIGEDPKEHNDSWVRMASGVDIEDEEPLNGWTKAYMNDVNAWSWRTKTTDSVGNPLRQYFSAGDHVIEISGRSFGHAIDRVVLIQYESQGTGDDKLTSLPESATSTEASATGGAGDTGNAGGDGAASGADGDTDGGGQSGDTAGDTAGESAGDSGTDTGTESGSTDGADTGSNGESAGTDVGTTTGSTSTDGASDTAGGDDGSTGGDDGSGSSGTAGEGSSGATAGDEGSTDGDVGATAGTAAESTSDNSSSGNASGGESSSGETSGDATAGGSPVEPSNAAIVDTSSDALEIESGQCVGGELNLAPLHDIDELDQGFADTASLSVDDAERALLLFDLRRVPPLSSASLQYTVTSSANAGRLAFQLGSHADWTEDGNAVETVDASGEAIFIAPDAMAELGSAQAEWAIDSRYESALDASLLQPETLTILVDMLSSGTSLSMVSREEPARGPRLILEGDADFCNDYAQQVVDASTGSTATEGSAKDGNVSNTSSGGGTVSLWWLLLLALPRLRSLRPGRATHPVQSCRPRIHVAEARADLSGYAGETGPIFPSYYSNGYSNRADRPDSKPSSRH